MKGLCFTNTIVSREGANEVIVDDDIAITGILLVDTIRSSMGKLLTLEDNVTIKGDLITSEGKEHRR